MTKRKLLIIIVPLVLLIAGYIGYSQIAPPLVPGTGRIELLEQTPQWQSFMKTLDDVYNYRGKSHNKQHWLKDETVLEYRDYIRKCLDAARALKSLIRSGLISKIEVSLISGYFSDWLDNFANPATQTAIHRSTDIDKDDALKKYAELVEFSAYKRTEGVLPSLKAIAKQDCILPWVTEQCLFSRIEINDLQRMLASPQLIKYWSKPIDSESIKKLLKETIDASNLIRHKNMALLIYHGKASSVVRVDIIQPSQNKPLELRRPESNLLLKEISHVLTMPPKTSYAPLLAQPDFKLIVYFGGGGTYNDYYRFFSPHDSDSWDIISEKNWLPEYTGTDVGRMEYEREFEVYSAGTLLRDTKTNNVYNFNIDKIYLEMINTSPPK